MKKTNRFSWLVCVLLLAGHVSAQTYTLSVETMDYEPLQGGQALVDDVWDDPELNVPIGFGFEYFSKTIHDLVLRGNFNIISLAENSISDVFSLFIVFGADLVDRGLLDSIHLSPIAYRVTGSQGSRVLTVEWENAGFFGDLYADGISDDYVTFQFKLYEQNGDIVFHFGPNSVTTPTLAYSGYDGPFLGLAEDYDAGFDVVNGEVLLLSGDPLDPDINTDYDSYYLDATIPENTRYKFSRQSTATYTLADVETKMFYAPNPARGYIHLKSEFQDDVLSPVDVYNMDGNHVKSFQDVVSPDLGVLLPGVYVLKMKTHNGIHSERLIVLPE